MTDYRTYRTTAKPSIFYMPNAEKDRLMAHVRDRQNKGEDATLQIVCGEALDLYADRHGLTPFNVRSMRQDSERT